MLTLFSPAKINLFLRIFSRRPDGYHELASLFQTLDLGDTLHFSPSQEDQLTCTDPTIPCDRSNLIFSVVDLFRKKTGRSFPLAIHVQKRIPSQAGLGGGSSNAATALWAINQLYNHPVSEQELQTWAAEIGSDVPFFFSHGTAYCTGRGEIVRDLSPLNLPSLSIYKPTEGLSTATIYKALNLEECSNENPEYLLDCFLHSKPRFVNDLEKVALRVLPSLQHFKNNLLKQGYTSVTMTGSGTAFFCVGGEEKVLPLNRRQNQWYHS